MNVIRNVTATDTPTLCIRERATVEISADRATITIELPIDIAAQKSEVTTTTAADKVRTILEHKTRLRAAGETIERYCDYQDRIRTEWQVKYIAEHANTSEVQAELEEVISRLAGIEQCQISGPHWQLSAALQAAASVKAHTLALHNAQQKAEQLAATTGYTIAELVQIDTGLSEAQTQVYREEQREILSENADLVPPQAFDMHLTPALVEVTGEITAVFTLVAAQPIQKPT